MAPGKAGLSRFLDPALCANNNRMIDGEPSICLGTAQFPCSKCKLVQYCTEDCQRTDWEFHRETCNSDYLKEPYVPKWVAEDRVPDFLSEERTKPAGSGLYLWGNMPALDILKLDQNERLSKTRDEDMNLLFAASGDLRNVVKTVLGLPQDYAGKCTIVINDLSHTITARNAILLLTALQIHHELATPIMLHICYSVLIPREVLSMLREWVLPPINGICETIEDSPDERGHRYRFVVGTRSLRLRLTTAEWFHLQGMFSNPDGFSASEAQDIRRKVTMSRLDHIDGMLCRLSPGQRASAMHFRQHGILLPLGASRQEFTIPNPTFFSGQDSWPMFDVADPLDGWAHSEYINHAQKAENDVYGTLFFFLRAQLLEFGKRVRSFDVEFSLMSLDALVLPEAFPHERFDRIEISNICDRCFLGPEAALSTFSPLLKTRFENPKATLLTLFVNAYKEGRKQEKESQSSIIPQIMELSGRTLRIMRYLDVTESAVAAAVQEYNTKSKISAQSVLIVKAMRMFEDSDRYFESYLKNPGGEEGADICMHELASENGLRVKSEHTIVEPWPYRVTENTTREQFNVLAAMSFHGHQRYMEFEKM